MTDARLETCRFCGTHQDRDGCIQGGWVPYFYTLDTAGEWVSEDAPVCPSCVSQHLVFGDDREWGLRESHHLPDEVN